MAESKKTWLVTLGSGCTSRLLSDDWVIQSADGPVPTVMFYNRLEGDGDKVEVVGVFVLSHIVGFENVALVSPVYGGGGTGSGGLVLGAAGPLSGGGCLGESRS